jgi:Protein of unknown function (DUF2958)
MAKLSPTETLERHIDENGVPPGPRKLGQFKEALTLRDTPAIYAQEAKAEEAVVYIKLFDPCGSWTWFITEWDGDDQAFGLVRGHCDELGYCSLTELASVEGALAIGLEIDVYFLPQALRDARRIAR